MKITTEICVSHINAMRPGHWKRASKRGNAEIGIVREFKADDVPGVTAVVGEMNDQIAYVRFEEGQPTKQKHELYFVLDDCEESKEYEFPIFIIVPKQFWEKHHHLDDQVGAHNINLPEGFGEMMEATFEYEGSAAEGARALVEAGFIPMPPPGLAAMRCGATDDDYDDDEVLEDNDVVKNIVETSGSVFRIDDTLNYLGCNNGLFRDFEVDEWKADHPGAERRVLDACSKIMTVTEAGEAEGLMIVTATCIVLMDDGEVVLQAGSEVRRLCDDHVPVEENDDCWNAGFVANLREVKKEYKPALIFFHH